MTGERQRKSIAWCGNCGNVSVDGINFSRVDGGLECGRCGAVSEDFEYVRKTSLAEPAREEKLREALSDFDKLIDEVLDTWLWPIRTYGEMRSWMRRLIAVRRALSVFDGEGRQGAKRMFVDVGGMDIPGDDSDIVTDDEGFAPGACGPSPDAEIGSEERPLGMGDVPELIDWSLNQLEEYVAGKFLTHDLQRYLGNAWRVVGRRNSAFNAEERGSACAGYISLGPVPAATVERARKIAVEAGLIPPEPEGAAPRGAEGPLNQEQPGGKQGRNG